jgi:hypothetical protein
MYAHTIATMGEVEDASASAFKDIADCKERPTLTATAVITELNGLKGFPLFIMFTGVSLKKKDNNTENKYKNKQ